MARKRFGFSDRVIAFMNKIRADAPGGCWVWTGDKHPAGYGKITTKMGGIRSRAYAHRFAFEVFVGPIPDGAFVCHHCDRPECVNPAHLFIGTPADNAADMASKNRSTRGEKNPMAKLNSEQVRRIRALRSYGVSCRAIASEFHVSVSLIYAI